MAVIAYLQTDSTHNVVGLSSDTKPTTGISTNSHFFETDTGRVFYYNGTSWFGDETALPKGYVQGHTETWSTVARVQIAAGKSRSDDDTYDIVSTGTLTADLTVSGANGLDTGAEAGSTWYALYVIGDPTGANATASLLSVSFSSPTLPSGYTKKRRVGVARNNGSSDIIKFNQRWNGTTRRFWWADTRANIEVLGAGQATTFTAVVLSALVPTSSKNVLLSGWFEAPTIGGAATNTLSLRTTGSGVSDGPYTVGFGVLIDNKAYFQKEMPCDSSQSIDYLVSDSDDIANIIVEGFDDEI